MLLDVAIKKVKIALSELTNAASALEQDFFLFKHLQASKTVNLNACPGWVGVSGRSYKEEKSMPAVTQYPLRGNADSRATD